MIFYALLLSVIIIIANYTVQFSILNSPLTWGAITYPFSFLLLDIISEKYDKKYTIKVLFIGLLIAFYPSYLCASFNIAIASIIAFCISQPLDVLIFYFLKYKAPKIWILRNVSSTFLAQLVDTLVFFTIAFWGVNAIFDSIIMALTDYSIKIIISFMNIPLFYIFAIYKFKRFFKN